MVCVLSNRKKLNPNKENVKCRSHSEKIIQGLEQKPPKLNGVRRNRKGRRKECKEIVKMSAKKPSFCVGLLDVPLVDNGCHAIENKND